MFLTLRASRFESLSLNNSPPTDPTALLQTRWQIATDTSGHPDSLVEDTWFIADDFIKRDFEAGLFARVQFRDNLGVVSDWSEWLVIRLPRATLERAWAFTLDGHIFYVLNSIHEAALVYDISTRQWGRWLGYETLEGGVEPFWNMFRGIVWKGRVLACGMGDNKVWEMDPHSMLDEGQHPIRRVVTGFLPLRGSASARQGALRVTARKEDATQDATIAMRFSDDNGKTWSAERTVALAANAYAQNIEFRSLGRIRAPGRLWEISDTGGFVRIEGADADLEGGA